MDMIMKSMQLKLFWTCYIIAIDVRMNIKLYLKVILNFSLVLTVQNT